MAQSQAAGHGFAQFWMHNGMVTYQGEKMSKSIGNTISPAEMLDLASPRVVRYYLGQAHYRSVLDYRPTSLEEAGAAVERIDGFISRAVRALAAGGDDGFVNGTVPEPFERAMDDDLNVPQALAVVHETVRSGNTALTEGRLEDAQQALHNLHDMLRVLGLNAVASGPVADARESEALGVLVEAQLAARAQARAEKNWAASDGIRDTLAAAGVVVEDGPEGATWSLKKD